MPLALGSRVFMTPTDEQLYQQIMDCGPRNANNRILQFLV